MSDGPAREIANRSKRRRRAHQMRASLLAGAALAACASGLCAYLWLWLEALRRGYCGG